MHDPRFMAKVVGGYVIVGTLGVLVIASTNVTDLAVPVFLVLLSLWLFLVTSAKYRRRS
jgi:hypothetical protein